MKNLAGGEARGDHLLFLDDDTEVIASGWLEAMLEHSQRPEVGAVGSRLLFPDHEGAYPYKAGGYTLRTIQHAGVVLEIREGVGHAFRGFPGSHPGYHDFARVVRNFSAVTAACLMTRKAVFEELDGFDETFDVCATDVDLCLRLREHGYLWSIRPTRPCTITRRHRSGRTIQKRIGSTRICCDSAGTTSSSGAIPTTTLISPSLASIFLFASENRPGSVAPRCTMRPPGKR